MARNPDYPHLSEELGNSYLITGVIPIQITQIPLPGDVIHQGEVGEFLMAKLRRIAFGQGFGIGTSILGPDIQAQVAADDPTAEELVLDMIAVYPDGTEDNLGAVAGIKAGDIVVFEQLPKPPRDPREEAPDAYASVRQDWSSSEHIRVRRGLMADDPNGRILTEVAVYSPDQAPHMARRHAVFTFNNVGQGFIEGLSANGTGVLLKP